MQYAVDAVDIVFDAKTSNQWIQWMQSHSGHSRIVIYGGGYIVFDTKKVKMDAVDAVHSGCSTQWMQ